MCLRREFNPSEHVIRTVEITLRSPLQTEYLQSMKIYLVMSPVANQFSSSFVRFTVPYNLFEILSIKTDDCFVT